MRRKAGEGGARRKVVNGGETNTSYARKRIYRKLDGPDKVQRRKINRGRKTGTTKS